MKNNKKTIACILNIILIILEIIGLFMCISRYNKVDIVYYTVDSNLLALVTSVIYLVNLISKKKIKRYVSILKYISTLSVTVTFLVVLFILAPMYNFIYKYLLFYNELLYYHTLCPIIAFISFVFFEEHKIKGIKDNIRAMYFTFIYAGIFIILNVLNIVEGPYPFLMVYKNSIYISFIWLFAIIGGTFTISKIIEIAKNKLKQQM